MAEAIQVVGLREMVQAFQRANREVAKDLRTVIEQAGEPIRREAELNVQGHISGMARSHVPWWSMRTGVVRSTIGYVAPLQRGVKGPPDDPRRRPKLKERMAPEMQAALDHNRDRVVDEFDDALGELVKAWARF